MVWHAMPCCLTLVGTFKERRQSQCSSRGAQRNNECDSAEPDQNRNGVANISVEHVLTSPLCVHSPSSDRHVSAVWYLSSTRPPAASCQAMKRLPWQHHTVFVEGSGHGSLHVLALLSLSRLRRGIGRLGNERQQDRSSAAGQTVSMGRSAASGDVLERPRHHGVFVSGVCLQSEKSHISTTCISGCS